MKFEIKVGLQSNVFNVEAKEILSSLQSNGYDVNAVQTAKLFVVDVTGSDPETIVREIAQNVLSNTVIETFSIRKIDD